MSFGQDADRLLHNFLGYQGACDLFFLVDDWMIQTYGSSNPPRETQAPRSPIRDA